MAAPLRHISVVAEVLQKGLEKDGARVNQALADIKLTSDRILTDSISLINWIKYSNKTIPVNKKTIHLNSLAKDILQVYASSARNKGVELRNEIEKWWFIEADYTILSTIFNNIISNAVKYSLSGVITVFCEKDDANSTIIKISDEGMGMSAEILYKIREILKGNLAVLKTYDESSTRLGYVLVGELLRIHHLQMQVDSVLNEGTVVSVILPGTSLADAAGNGF